MYNLIVLSAVSVFVFMVFMFVIAQILKNNSIVDIGWGIGFIVITSVLLFNKAVLDLGDIILTLMVLIWGVRLAMHIYFRAAGKGEDFRYAEWRKNWGKKAMVNAFFRVFMLQGLIMLIIALPIIIEFNHINYKLNNIAFVGVLIFGFGLLFESIGDWQLFCFKKNKNNKGKIITTGLWKFTRHPNYFGETVVWWGIGVFTLSSELWYVSLISPLILNLLLLFVSGVPLLEKKYEGNADWEEYKKVTPTFLPFWGKKG